MGALLVTLPLGIGAYKRIAAAEPEVRLINRFVEKAVTNLREHIALIGRPGTQSLRQFLGGNIRALYCKPGSFNGDLFIVAGSTLWRWDGTTATAITGTIAGTGNPNVTWMKGLGYEFLFIADGTNFWYYSTHAVGVLTLSGGSITDFQTGGQTIVIHGVHYAWSANVEYNTPAGSLASPYLALLGSATPDGFGLTGDASSLSNMALLLNFTGLSGTDYSLEVPGPNAVITAVAASNLPLELVLTAIAPDSTGNTITTTATGSHLTWSGATLAGGGGTALQAVTGMGAGETIQALANVSSYVLASVGNSQKFYWLNPGTTIIDPLNFAEKESNPDNVLDMLTVGDQVIIAGNGSMENWYASGNFDAPFLPYEGRVYVRGVVLGTLVNVNDSAIFIGNDGVVYEVGYTYGDTVQYGAHRISDHGIEERIRMQLRREQGLAP